ncbi:hypothetical protein ACKFKH_30720, partial [Phormidesmis sp. 146-20]
PKLGGWGAEAVNNEAKKLYQIHVKIAAAQLKGRSSPRLAQLIKKDWTTLVFCSTGLGLRGV